MSPSGTAIVAEFAAELLTAAESRTPVDPITDRIPDLDPETAYAIQSRMIDERCSRGATVLGKKIGLTSSAMREMLGVHEPDFGRLLDDMHVFEGESVSLSTLIQPRAEGEIAFILDRDLDAPYVTAAHVLRATAFVVPAIEIIDSRIRDWKIRLADTIADNASSGLFVIGGLATPVAGLDLRALGMTLERNDEVEVTGAGAAALGNPASAVAWLANVLRASNDPLRAGDIVLSGGLAAAVAPAPGDAIRVTIERLGEVSVRFSA